MNHNDWLRHQWHEEQRKKSWEDHRRFVDANRKKYGDPDPLWILISVAIFIIGLAVIFNL